MPTESALSNFTAGVTTTSAALAGSSLNVSPEAVAFLGFVAVCLVLLIIFFLYLNKMFCFKEIGGFPCIDRPPSKKFDPTTGREYGIAEDEDDDECDSEDDAVNQFQRHRSIRLSLARRRSGPSTPPLSTTQTEHSEPSAAVASVVAAAIDQLTLTSEGNYAAVQQSDTASLRNVDAERVPILEGAADSKELTIDMSFSYNSSRGELTITVKQAKNVSNQEWQYQVHVAILPAKKFVFRTNYAKSESPLFLAVFSCRISPENLPDTYVRVRLYGRAVLLSPAKLVGAAIVSLATLPLDQEISRSAPLQASEEGLWAIDVVESTGDAQLLKQVSVSDPIISVGLAYSALTGRLTVDIGQAQALNKLMRQAPQKLETYIKILVMLGTTADQLLAQAKTRLSKGYSPTFREKFVFQVAQFQLPEVSLGIMVYTRRRENIGWVTIGSVADAVVDASASAHWNDLRSAAATHSSEMLTRIHVIRPPEQVPKDGTTSSIIKGEP